jgi:predicted DsbA family dithiol-disulfide isomerase
LDRKAKVSRPTFALEEKARRPGSVFAAKAALASDQQGKYFEFNTALNATLKKKNEVSVLRTARYIGLNVDKLKTDTESQSVVETVRRNHRLAQSLSIDGTPTFVFDDVIEPSFASFSVMMRHVAAIRQNGGCKVC